MQDFSFQGLGTEWSILVDAPVFSSREKQAVLDTVKRFEQRFSRFLWDSEVNAFRESDAGTYPLSEELFILLERAEKLRTLTAGAYDPAVGALLERAGYGYASKGSHEEGSVDDFVLPSWSLTGRELVIDGPTAFDFGGIGKGYCIDIVSRLLSDVGQRYFLVEGGGDMYGTKKRDGSAWQIAIEYPGNPELMAGTVALADQGLAVSDRFRRRFGDWHHVVDPKRKRPTDSIDGCAAVAPDAWAADCMTSGLFLAEKNRYPTLAQAFEGEYLVFFRDGKAEVSADWKGELFS